MKWAIFLSALVAGVPFLVVLMHLRRWAVHAVMALFFVLLMNDLNGFLSINLISHEWYRGSSRGMEVTALDLIGLALALHVVLHRPRGFRRQWLSWEGGLLGLYLSAGLISMVASMVPLYSWFGLWKMGRGVLIFAVFSQLIDREERVRFLLLIFGFMCLYQAPVVLYQKYLLGIYRAAGTLPHMNTLAMLNNMLIMPVFAAFLLDRGRPRPLYLLFIVAAMFNLVATLSRGAMVSMAGGFALSLLFLRLRHLEPRRIGFAVLLLCGIVAGAFKASDTIVDRFLNAPKESAETRISLNLAAMQMADTRVLGVGLNNFSHAIANTRFGRLAPEDDYGVAHHIYWLTAAELGYAGLFLFVALIGVVQLRAARLGLTSAVPLLKALGIGLFAAMIALHLQGLLEWILRQTNVWFLFCAQAGSLVAATRLSASMATPAPSAGGRSP